MLSFPTSRYHLSEHFQPGSLSAQTAAATPQEALGQPGEIETETGRSEAQRGQEKTAQGRDDAATAVARNAVEDQLSVIEHLEADLDTKLKSAQALRQSILRHAFAGQLVPQDPNDEPASEVLKRIAAEREERIRLAAATKEAVKKAKSAKVAKTRKSRKRAAARS